MSGVEKLEENLSWLEQAIELMTTKKFLEVEIDLGFCDADDHLLVGIGGSRLWIMDGIWMMFELWATPDDLDKAVDLLPGLEVNRCQPIDDKVTLHLASVGPKGAALQLLLADPKARQTLKVRLGVLLANFRLDPQVARATAYWKSIRQPD